MARPKLFYAVVILSVLALALELTGVVFPGWVMMRRNLKEINIEQITFPVPEEQRGLPMPMDDDDMTMPMDPMMQDPMGEPRPGPSSEPEGPNGNQHPAWPHHDGNPHKRHRDDDSSSEEDDDDWEEDTKKRCDEAEDWFFGQFNSAFQAPPKQELFISFEDIKVSLHYGLMFSRFCVHKPDVDSKYEDKHDKKHGKVDCCTRKSEEILREFGFFFERVPDLDTDKLSVYNMGYGHLNQHRCLSFTAVIFTLLGLILGVLGFRNQEACKCFRVACMFAMVISTALLAVPVGRFACYNRYHHHEERLGDPKVVHPVSVLTAGAGVILTAICVLLALIGVCQKRAMKGRWYRFNNDVMTEKEGKKPGVVLHAEPLPQKVNLSFTPAVCEVDIVPPYTEEKMPIE